MDEVYRGYRIAITRHETWRARITAARGPVAPFRAEATLVEGAPTCARRARALIDRYIAFLENHTQADRPATGNPAPHHGRLLPIDD